MRKRVRVHRQEDMGGKRKEKTQRLKKRRHRKRERKGHRWKGEARNGALLAYTVQLLWVLCAL